MKFSRQKETIRQYYINLRKTISDKDASLKANLATETLFEFFKFKKTHVLALYLPIKHEITTEYIFAKCENIGLTTALPIIQEQEGLLIFKKWQRGEELVKNLRYGVKEPVCANKICIPDYVIVPIVAFDKNCYRLGYGGGFYDRTIRKLSHEGGRQKVCFIGLAYFAQQVEALPIYEHDQKLDFVVTEEGVIVNKDMN